MQPEDDRKVAKKIAFLALIILAALTLDGLRQGIFAWMGVQPRGVAAVSHSGELTVGTSSHGSLAGAPEPSASAAYPPPDPSGPKIYLPLIIGPAGQ